MVVVQAVERALRPQDHLHWVREDLGERRREACVGGLEVRGVGEVHVGASRMRGVRGACLEVCVGVLEVRGV